MLCFSVGKFGKDMEKWHVSFRCRDIVLQWNPSKADTIGTRIFVRYSEVSVAQGFRCSRA